MRALLFPIICFALAYTSLCFADHLTCYSHGKIIFDGKIEHTKLGDNFVLFVDKTSHKNTLIMADCILRDFKLPEHKEMKHAVDQVKK